MKFTVEMALALACILYGVIGLMVAISRFNNGGPWVLKLKDLKPEHPDEKEDK